MPKFLLRVHPQRGQRALATTVEFDGEADKACARAEELLAPDGIAEVEVFQRIENGRLSKRITSTWSS